MGADYIGELVQAYFEETPQLLSKLQQALREQDCEASGRQPIPSSPPATASAPWNLERMAKELEMMGRAGKLEGAAGKVEALDGGL